MSSHHFVKDKQEPALIIANGEACSFELLGQLLEWNPFIVVLDGAAERVMQLGIQFDVLLGDFDKEHHFEEIRQIFPNLKIVHTPDQNKTDLQKGIEYLISNGHSAVNIVWATGRRSDHFVANIASIATYYDKINLTLIDDYSKIYTVKSPFKKHFNKGDILSLIPLNKVENIFTKNLLYPLKADILEFPQKIGSSNEAKETGLVEIIYDTGVLLMMECKDKKE